MTERRTRREVLRGLVVAGYSLALSTGCSSLPLGNLVPKRMPQVAYVYLYRAGPSRPFVNDFSQALRDLGWTEGSNIGVEIWDAEGSAEKLSSVVADLVARKTDVIVAAYTPEAKAAQKLTDSIPIVVAAVGDPVKAGLVYTLAHPGGNVTGVSAMLLDLSAKRIELLMEAVPGLASAAVVWNPDRPDNEPEFDAMQAEAQQLGVKLQSLPVHTPGELESALEVLRAARIGALLNLGDTLLSSQATRIVSFAAQERIPAMYENREYPDVGGLMSYGPNFPALHRRAASYVDRILKGAHPADLPVELPDRFEFVVNIGVASGLGLTFPRSLLVSADSIIS